MHYRRSNAWPVLSGVADWIVGRVAWTERGAEILGATGPAEVPTPPDNHAFTLMAAADVLGRAIRAAEKLGHHASDEWSKVLDHL